MLISLLNGHKKYGFLKHLLAVFLLFFLTLCEVKADKYIGTISDEIAILKVLKNDPYLPMEARPVIKYTGGGRKQVPNGQNIIFLIPIYISYENYQNTYCRIITYDKKMEIYSLVNIPSQLETDNCSGFSEPITLDLNGDNIEDFIFRTNIKANFAYTSVAQYWVFLSQTNDSLSYCIAEKASLFLSDEIKSKAIRESLLKESKRVGKDILKCEND